MSTFEVWHYLPMRRLVREPDGTRKHVSENMETRWRGGLPSRDAALALIARLEREYGTGGGGYRIKEVRDDQP